MDQDRVLILGAGVVGLATAHALVRAGRPVTILERCTPCSGASLGNAGEVCPAELSPLAGPGVIRVALTNSYRRGSALYVQPRAVLPLGPFFAHLVRHSNMPHFRAGVQALTRFGAPTFELFDRLRDDGVEVGLRMAPYLHVYSSRLTAENRRAYRAQTFGIEGRMSDIMQHEELRALEPSIGQKARFGFLVNGHGYLDPAPYLSSLLSWLRARAVEIHEGTSITAMREEGGRGAVRVVTSRGDFTGGALVITAGVGSAELARLLGIRLPIVAGKGYSFAISPGSPVRHVIKPEEAHIAVTPMASEVRVAGTMEFDLEPQRFNRKRVSAIVAAASPYFTGIDWDTRTHEWVGPRPMTSDGLPIIDRLPGSNSLHIASGHNMLGLLLSPATGQAVADLVNRRPPTSIAPFRIDRFPRWLVNRPR